MICNFEFSKEGLVRGAHQPPEVNHTGRLENGVLQMRGIKLEYSPGTAV